MPSNRKNQLYAYTRNQWEPVGDFQINQWHDVEIIFSSDHFTVKINNVKAKKFNNPILNPNPRLYLGDGYEVDIFESNRGSEFFIELSSITTDILK